MPNYVRSRVAGGTYFFTVVTRDRRPVLTDDACRGALRAAVLSTRQRWPFTVDAWVLLPGHLHCIWTLPSGDADFSKRWSATKRMTSQALGRSVWQPRFWEHSIRDESDLQRHMNYLHGNPVKHGYVPRAIDWPYSTFHRYVALGRYAADWYDTAPDEDWD